MNGTVKVGRWEYPARKLDSGIIERNTKRDGSGEWVIASEIAFTPDAPTQTESQQRVAKLMAGKRTWLPGTKCPNGHTLNDTTRYVMPSGRVQCRECRRSYASNL